ncbi:uncharacterized protein LOC117661625 [Pantherophis guttatus]|uniref:Uncharacterized protein LOC117661625 n=1 Tax=Pantherophis guttatus TaxID=94885 RepID=A0ABM3ZDC9_PANGU|nr:uncharacterized protein LOC117661625 [Pantherophis guttatus]
MLRTDVSGKMCSCNGKRYYQTPPDICFMKLILGQWKLILYTELIAKRLILQHCCKFKPKSISFLKAFSKQGTQVCGTWNAGIVMMSVEGPFGPVVAPLPEPVSSAGEDSESEGEELARPPSPGPSSLAMPSVSAEGQEIGPGPSTSTQPQVDSDESNESWLDPRQRRRDKRAQQKKRHARD